MKQHDIILNKLDINRKNCKPIIAPYDVILKDEIGFKRVQHDIFIIYEKDYSDLDRNEFEGIHALVIEILSRSNAANNL